MFDPAAHRGNSASLANKTVLITGATSGIGQATALAFARRGANVAIIGRDIGRGRRAIAVCEGVGARASFIEADVTVPAQLRDAVARTCDHFGGLDVAFNNAGIQERRAPLAEQPDDVFDAVFGANVRAVFQAMKAEITAMLSAGGGGAIINNASVSGVRNPNPGFSLYSASKAAVISLVRSAAMEAAPRGVRINAIAPGRVVTDMMLRSGVGDMASVAAGLPLKRMGRPEEVAEAVVWLLSDASSYVVGHVLAADGGFLAS